jgi:HK97 gp10 family phage protein
VESGGYIRRGRWPVLYPLWKKLKGVVAVVADIDIEIVTEIEGLDELERDFTEGSKRTVKKFLKRVEMKAANVLVKSAEASAPYETGQLEGDIHRQTVEGDGALTVRVGPSQQTFYGIMHEWGAPEANQPAQHWLENSARSVQEQVLTEYYEGLREGLEDMKG